MLLGAVHTVIQDACQAASVAPTASVTLPDITLNLPPIDYARFDQAPVAYLQHYLMPVLRDQLAPTLAVLYSPSVTPSLPDPVTPSVSETAPESDVMTRPTADWSDVEAALILGRGPLATSANDLITALLHVMTAASPPPLHHWLLLPTVRHRLWSALRQSGWATQMPLVLQSVFSESQIQPLLPCLLTQGLPPTSHLALWEAALGVLSDPSFSAQIKTSAVLYVQSFALLNRTRLSDTTLQHRLDPLRRWLAQSPDSLQTVQSWLAITRAQGVHDQDLANLDRSLLSVTPTIALPDAIQNRSRRSVAPSVIPPAATWPDVAAISHSGSVPRLAAWRTLLSQLQSLPQCAGDLVACQQQVLALLTWLDNCDPPLDAVVLQPIIVALQHFSAEVARLLLGASATLPQVNAWLQAVPAEKTRPTNAWFELLAVLCADHSVPHQLQSALSSLGSSPEGEIEDIGYTRRPPVLRAVHTLFLLRESPRSSCLLPLPDPVTLATWFDIKAWSIANSAANFPERMPVLFAAMLWQAVLPPAVLPTLWQFSRTPAAASQSHLVARLHDLTLPASDADSHSVSPDDIVELKTWFQSEDAILHDYSRLVESVLTTWQQHAPTSASLAFAPVLSGLTQLLQSLRSQPVFVDRAALLRLIARLSLLLSVWHSTATHASDETILRSLSTFSTHCRALVKQLSALDESLIADFSQHEGWWLPLVVTEPNPELSPLLQTLTHHLMGTSDDPISEATTADTIRPSSVQPISDTTTAPHDTQPVAEPWQRSATTPPLPWSTALSPVSRQQLQTAAASHEAAQESLAWLTASQQQTQTLLTSCHLPAAIQRVQDFITLSEQVQTKQQEPGWACQDAGLVLLWPHLKTLFSRLALLDEAAAFIDEAAQLKAQAMLIALLGAEPCAEMWCIANTLVGLPADTLISEPISLRTDELDQIDPLLSAVIAQWSALKQMSLPAFRALFLRREGTLYPDDQGFRLEVTPHPADVLLSKLPWGIGIIALPWLPSKLLRVDWSDGLS